jgi:hypothetical protein
MGDEITNNCQGVNGAIDCRAIGGYLSCSIEGALLFPVEMRAFLVRRSPQKSSVLILFAGVQRQAQTVLFPLHIGDRREHPPQIANAYSEKLCIVTTPGG